MATDKQGYVTSEPYVYANATMTQSGNAISALLGTVSQGRLDTLDDTVSPLTWSQNSAAYDAAGNPMSTASFTETDNDVDF